MGPRVFQSNWVYTIPPDALAPYVYMPPCLLIGPLSRIQNKSMYDAVPRFTQKLIRVYFTSRSQWRRRRQRSRQI